jgi:hypothetical protein
MKHGAGMRDERKRGHHSPGSAASQPYRVRLTDFILEQDIELEEFVKRVTSSIGIRPCGCEGCAAVLNR